MLRGTTLVRHPFARMASTGLQDQTDNGCYRLHLLRRDPVQRSDSGMLEAIKHTADSHQPSAL